MEFIPFCFLADFPGYREEKKDGGNLLAPVSWKNQHFRILAFPTNARRFQAVTTGPAVTVTAAAKPQFHLWDKIPAPFPCPGAQQLMGALLTFQ